ncbi:MAG: hypothetical protein HY770_04005 [Chitinivibrionia bacterium]|nr:hypothetical protein [Chitinivibrionia bacterium]
MWAVYYNHELLTRDELAGRGIGIPKGAGPAEALTAYIVEKGRTIMDPGTGRPFPVEFSGIPEGAVGTPPDLIVTGTYDGYMVEFWDMKNPHTSIVRELAANERWDHRRDGVFLAYGNGVRRGYDAGAKNIEDIAPSLLYMMGLPLSANLDGTIMEDIFLKGALVRDPIAIVRDFGWMAEGARVADEKREDLEKELKSLGYIR